MTDDTSTRLDTVLAILSDADRRRLLYYLREQGTATRTELADVLTGWQATDRSNGATTADDRQRIGCELHHQHIPVLRDGGLVSVSLDSAVVERTDWPPWVDQYLDLAFELEATADTGTDTRTDPSTEEPN